MPYTEDMHLCAKKNGTTVLCRKISIYSGKAVLIAKDTVLIGQSVREMKELIRMMAEKFPA